MGTVALTYIASSIQNSGAAANLAERNKEALYEDLTSNNAFQPLAFDNGTTGGRNTQVCVTALSSNPGVYEEKRATFLRQRISMEIQWANATCVRGNSVIKNSLGEITLPNALKYPVFFVRF